MSLQVWLPLNGNTSNQGLSNQTFSISDTATITLDNAGKIGKCYNFNGTTGNGIYSNDNGFMDNYINNKSWSLCAWIKTTSTNTCVLALTYGITLWVGSSPQISLGRSGSNTIICHSSGNTIDGNWHHICATYNIKSNIINFYMDGVKTGEQPYTSGSTYASSWTNGLFIGRNPNDRTTDTDRYFYKGKINDVRIYDHCLSEKEVKEISKGLVLHYKLSNNYIQNVTNLLPQTTSYSTPTYAWDSTLNGNPAKVPTSWSGGYNSGVANPATGYHARWEMLNNELDMCFPNLPPSTGRWLGISGNVNASSIPAGQKYTISFDMKSDVVGAGITGGLYYKINSSATSASFHDGNATIGVSTKANEWEHFSYTYTRSSSYDGNTPNCYFYFYSNYAKTATTYVKNMQLQVGSIATGYVPGGTAYQEVTEYDCSGFGNNGTISGNLIIDINSPRYNDCYKFNSTTVDNTSNTLSGAAYITGPCSLITPNAITVSWWDKIEKYGRGGIFETTANTSDFVNGTDYNTTAFANWDSTFGIYNGTTRINLFSYILRDNQWHHYGIIFNGTQVVMYRDGNSVYTGNLAGTLPTFNGIKIGIGKAGGVYRQILKTTSDFRIYVTALSAEDVKELYENKISVDSTEKIHAYEFKEE